MNCDSGLRYGSALTQRCERSGGTKRQNSNAHRKWLAARSGQRARRVSPPRSRFARAAMRPLTIVATPSCCRLSHDWIRDVNASRCDREANCCCGGADRDRTDDLLSAISAFVSTHTRTLPDSIFYRRPDSSGLVWRERTRRETRHYELAKRLRGSEAREREALTPSRPPRRNSCTPELRCRESFLLRHR